jgi:hypothetical protein
MQVIATKLASCATVSSCRFVFPATDRHNEHNKLVVLKLLETSRESFQPEVTNINNIRGPNQSLDRKHIPSSASLQFVVRFRVQ